ncbi:hypothetical protein HPP92_002674 [Vanilla planifolia]|uniref:Uncharacterized protein n=1 Tax=Vanilla planifolia TaxID=51239 RepID=A0A835RWB1_VANPL|nr:hypothetical protein HPP92_002674 [Vanilla planifolia]
MATIEGNVSQLVGGGHVRWQLGVSRTEGKSMAIDLGDLNGLTEATDLSCSVGPTKMRVCHTKSNDKAVEGGNKGEDLGWRRKK